MANDKYLFVVSGAAGTGKDSVVKALREAHPEIEKTVSATTRAPRPGEQEGVDYYYRTREQFQQLIENDQVVEHNFYNGNYYGTLREEVDKRLAARKVVVLVIDVHGAANIRRMFPGATTVFLERIYKYAFVQYKMGLASAYSCILFVLILLFTAVQFWLQKKWVNYDA